MSDSRFRFTDPNAHHAEYIDEYQLAKNHEHWAEPSMKKERKTPQRRRADTEKEHADYDRYFSPQIIQVDRRCKPGGRTPHITDEERTIAAKLSRALEQAAVMRNGIKIRIPTRRR